MTKIFYASTLYGTMSLAAAIDAGLFGPHDERWVLLVSINTNAPEISDSFADSPAFATLRQRFDDVVRWNDVIAPLHPSAWTPAPAEVPMLSRFVLEHLAITDEVSELVVESIAVAPSRTLGILIRDCPITVYSDGLMSYGPTRDEVATEIGTRAARVLYLDLAPGVEPVLLRENLAVPVVVPDTAFRKVISELPAPEVGDAFGWPVIVGQYLAPLGILNIAEENTLYVDMLRAVAAAGHRGVVFAPHPSAGQLHTSSLQNAAADLGVNLRIAPKGLPIEAWLAAAHPDLVVSCFSTALFTAGRYFEIPAATMGADLVLERLAPFENSNRVPATLASAAIAALQLDGTRAGLEPQDLDELVKAVAFCMQPSRNAPLRPVAESYLRAHGPDRYVTGRRATRLGLQPAATVRARVSARLRRRALGYAVRTWALIRRSRIPGLSALAARFAARRR